jgi:molecular chaperone GrpE
VSEPQASEPEGAVEPPSSEPDGAAAAPSSEEQGELTVEGLLEALEQAVGQRDEYLALAQRTQAEFENSRKLAQRRLEDEVARRVGALAEKLLPVLDACDGALAHGAAEVEPVANALLQALEKEGLSRIDPLGQPFDPSVADAVVHEPGGGGEHVVSEVLRTGYAWQGRVIRPAMVKVTD